MNKVEKMERNKKFYLALHGTTLFVPYKLQENNEVALEFLMNGQGENFLPAFFSRGSQTGCFADEKFAEFDFSRLRDIFIELDGSAGGLVIEPFTKNIVIRKEDFEKYDSITKGMTVQRNDHIGTTKLQPARNLPKGLREAVCDFCFGEIGINALWAFRAKGENERRPHLMLSIDFYGSKFDLFPRLAEIVKPFMQPGESFELIERNPNIDLKQIAGAQIYRRGEKVES